MLNNPLQLIGMLQNSNNPMEIVRQMSWNIPKYAQIMLRIQGKDPQQLDHYVRNLYQSQGQDINAMASQFGLKI